MLTTMNIPVRRFHHYFCIFAVAVGINVTGILVTYIYAALNWKAYRAVESVLLIRQQTNSSGASVERYRFTLRQASTSPPQRHPPTLTANGGDLGGKATQKITSPKKLFMTINGSGRLGNKMFQYATLLAAARRHGYAPFVSSKHLLLEVFNMTHVSDVGMSNQEYFGEQKPGEFDSRVLSLSADKNMTLTGYYQSWKYFSNISDEVREEFTFRDEIASKATEVLRKYRQEGRILVGVHVRRADMLSQKLRGYNVADEKYLSQALGHFRKKYKDPLFLVCSDDMAWCRGAIQGDDVRFVGGNSVGVDLAILSQCKYSIITSGSFGWWAAWLAGGDTVYYNNYPRKGTWLDSVYTRKDYYPPTWIGME